MSEWNSRTHNTTPIPDDYEVSIPDNFNYSLESNRKHRWNTPEEKRRAEWCRAERSEIYKNKATKTFKILMNWETETS